MEAYRYSARFYDGILFPFIRPIRNKVIELVKRYRYRSILDVCCGTGDQLKLLKQHGFEGVGIDISDAMLSVAGKGAHKADCIHQDAAQMHYKDASFDLVMTAFALHEKEHDTARRIVEEMVRVTAEGGDMLIVDYELSEKTSPLSNMFIYFIEWVAGGEHYRNFRSYIKKGGLPALLSGIALTEIERHYFARHGIVLLLLRRNKI
ncbi:class I SAM-dependent methyltransferase [Sulfurovum sp.]|uniref:class I SAM-dependent methyltransferase n=1 Tax=Sulfurovum sp. TaxID=1969726 RepID=UPI0025E1F34C|nr:class I SAM-dependent methyltransferase [Sulfurovum sp.]